MPDTDDIVLRTLDEHLELGAHKPVSFLPIRTIERVLGLSVNEYLDMARKRGHAAVSFSPDQCCISSGDVYVYSPSALQALLDGEAETLGLEKFPSDASGFVSAIARDWFPMDHPLMGVIKQAFGDGLPAPG